MAALDVSQTLIKRINAWAQHENRSVEALLETLVAEYERNAPAHRTIEEQQAAMRAISGIFDDDITDLSMTVKEGFADAMKKKYGLAD